MPVAAGEPPPPVRLEASTPCAAPFDSEQWRFTVDWDGCRVCVCTGGDAVRIHDERGADAGARFADVALAVRSALAGRSAVLEGVVTVLDREGRPDLAALEHRLVEVGGPPRVLLAIDLLALDGRSLLSVPLDERQEQLHRAVPAGTSLQAPDWVIGSGHAFAAAAAERGLAAVLARRGSAPYRPGLASPDRLRISLVRRTDVIALGAVLHGGDCVALLLGEWADGRLVAAGRAAVPTGQSVVGRARSLVAARTVAAPPAGIPDEEGVTWLRPDLVATVSHHGRAADGSLRLPSLLALHDDREPAWCRRREPVPPPEDIPVATAGFRPTVLHTLPFDRP